MRSLRSKFVSACALSIASVTAAVLPSRAADVPRPDGKLLHYEFQHDYAQATFSVPCNGCLGSAHDTDQDDESLVLRFTSHAQDEACGSSNITLNGVQLSQEWNGDFATGSGSYTAGGTTDATQDDLSLQRDLDLEWNSACLHGDEETDEAAQVLTVSIKAIDGKALIIPSGFTVSFKQQTSPPSLLRFESVPDRSASDKDVAQYWRNPPAHLRLVANGTLVTQDSTVLEQSLENDLRELRELQAELRKLQQAIANKKDRINSQLRKEVSSLTDEINECEGLACIFKAIAHKAQGALKDAVERCKSKQINDMGRPSLDLYAPAHINAVQKSGGSIKVETINVQPYEEATDELPPRPTKTSPYIIALEHTVVQPDSTPGATGGAAIGEKTQERIEDYEEKRSLIQSQESVLEDAMQAEIRQLRAAHDVVNDLVRGAEEGRAPCNCHHTYPPSLASTYPPTVMSS
ncbi:hypothetical protein SNOG_06035 [Parastagonospora nodorum SN15]|uniref:Uncharacterized protein n=1 Tax=Phaeosphaeria nodorum (strain SN15 / ATCC MYA-4574 / FGSC 10173) TaxID=321614 RepID=Q0UQC9_PHANO|nr:hypothetical protein SNOG_06035 [Parastagonospora nodorum SN15]EAT87099.2 hypothetical protein SNOG_06035 [Parastagonospora nodorum SN15]